MSMNKLPEALVANNFAQICAAIDDGNLNETIVKLFNEQRLDLRPNVDVRIGFLRLCSAAIQSAKETRDAYRERVKQLEHVEDLVKKATLSIMAVHEKIVVEGDTGRLCVQKNPEALDLGFDVSELVVNRVIDPALIEAHNIPDKYLKKIAAYQLDTKQIKEDVKASVELPWAKLSKGTHIRIRT